MQSFSAYIKLNIRHAIFLGYPVEVTNSAKNKILDQTLQWNKDSESRKRFSLKEWW